MNPATHVEDTLAIRELLDEYCLRLEIDDFDAWLDLFTPDAEYEVFRRTLRGHAEIAEMLRHAPHGVHVGGAARIRIDGDSADVVQNYMFKGEDDSTSNDGWYFRTLTRTHDGWKISFMRVKVQKRVQAGVHAS